MKINADFITNSSSASFIILKINLTDTQIQMIHDHIEVGMIIADDRGHEMYRAPWQIRETSEAIYGSTGMDNFDMMWFLDAIGVHEDGIKYDGQ